MFKFVSSLLIVLTISVQVWAQCSVNFKETNRQALSNGFAFGHFDDFDNDGQEDLLGYSIVSTTNPLDGIQFHFYKRLSANSFDTTAKSTLISGTTNQTTIFVVGDINGDGFKDIIVQLWNPQRLVAYMNDGTGKFTTAGPTLTASDYVWAASDMNGDGKDDLLTSDSNGVNIRLTQPDNSFGDTRVIVQGAGNGIITGNGMYGIGYIFVKSHPFIIEDLNGDGLKDVAFVGGNQSDTLLVYTNNGNLNFTGTSASFGPIKTKLRAYDFNNDGKKDFVSDYPARVAINNGNNTFTSSQLNFFAFGSNRYAADYIAKTFIAGDFDGDGDTDVIYPGTSTSTLARNQGNGTFQTQNLNAYPGIDRTANLDNDGKADAVFLNYSVINSSYRLWDGSNWRYFYLHNAVSFRKNVCNPVGQTKVVDFNGDGYVDRSFWYPLNGSWRYYTQNGPLAYEKVYSQLGVTGDIPVPNDYDGDGKTDYAVYRRSNGTWTINGSTGWQVNQFNFGIAEDKPVPADYDGDGKADIAVYRPSSGDWHFWLSGTSQYLAVHFGVSEDKPVPSDFDGDGKADIAVYRPSSGVWYVLKSADNSVFIVQYGLSTDRPIPGDFDGDGKSNVAVYRDGVWYVLRPDLSTSGMYWGIAGDEPIFNDTLQAPTIGVYRSSNSTFHLSFQDLYPGNYAIPTENSSSEVFTSSILPPQ